MPTPNEESSGGNCSLDGDSDAGIPPAASKACVFAIKSIDDCVTEVDAVELSFMGFLHSTVTESHGSEIIQYLPDKQIFSNLYPMELPTFINWTNPFGIKGLLGSLFQFHSNLKAHPVNKKCRTGSDATVASDQVLHCLPMSIKRTLGLSGIMS